MEQFYGHPQFPQQPMYYPQYQQMQQAVMPMPQQPNNENRFVWVQGRESAKAYPTAPNKTIFFLDDQDPYIYKKVTDAEGRTSEFKAFKLVEETEEQPKTEEAPVASYVTAETFEGFAKEIREAIASLKDQRSYQHNKKGQNNESVNR